MVSVKYFAIRDFMDIPSIVRFCILVGSARTGGNTNGISKWVYNELSLTLNSSYIFPHDICIIDPHTKPHPVNPVLDDISPIMVKESAEYPRQEVRDWSQFIHSCSGMIIVTPEYNGGYPSTLKNALDVLFWEWNQKPAAVVTIGGGGGRKCDEQLRQVMSSVQMNVVEQRVQVSLPRPYTYTSQRVIPSELHDNFLVQYKHAMRSAFEQLIDKIQERSKTSRR